MATIEVPRILIATGRTCSGKTTLVGALIAQNSFVMLGAETTRPERDGDLPGEYRYHSDSTFDARLSRESCIIILE